MKSAKISELKNGLSRLLAYVRRGGTVRVFDRDRPVADLVPCTRGDTDATAESLLAELERDSVLGRGRGTLPGDFLERTLPRPKSSVLAALLDERAEGR